MLVYFDEDNRGWMYFLLKVLILMDCVLDRVSGRSVSVFGRLIEWTVYTGSSLYKA